MAYAKKTKKNEETSQNTTASSADEFVYIETKNIHPSPFSPQEKRRARFTDESLSELADSIRQKGLINPITVRRNQNGFELVAGERRWLASQKAGLDRIPSIVKILTDADALEIQLLENLQRDDVHPLDEAVWYKHLIDTAQINITEVALRVGKNAVYVHQRLKLNDLIADAQKDLASGKLPIGHALEIAKYAPDIQAKLHKEVFGWSGVQSFAELKRNIERSVLNLRPDGLACVDCPQRTGMLPTLFDTPSAEMAEIAVCRWIQETEQIVKIQNELEYDIASASENEVKEHIKKNTLLEKMMDAGVSSLFINRYEDLLGEIALRAPDGGATSLVEPFADGTCYLGWRGAENDREIEFAFFTIRNPVLRYLGRSRKKIIKEIRVITAEKIKDAFNWLGEKEEEEKKINVR